MDRHEHLARVGAAPHEPLATLQAAVNEGRTTIIVLSAICVLVACAILFGLIRQLVGGPLGAMARTVKVMAEGDYSVTVPGTERVDEVGTLARAVEVFRENGKKVAEMTEAEAVRIIRDQEARVKMMAELQQAFGGVVDAAIDGDFSRRVAAGVTYLGTSEKAQRDLGFAARPLEEGLRETLEYELGRLGDRGMLTPAV